MIDEEFKKRLVEALERIADCLEQTTDESGLLHVLVRTPEADDDEESDGVS